MARMGAVQTTAAMRRILVVVARMTCAPSGGRNRDLGRSHKNARARQILRAGLAYGDPPAGSAEQRRSGFLAGLRDLTIEYRWAIRYETPRFVKIGSLLGQSQRVYQWLTREACSGYSQAAERP